jgi:hypothetical protein
VHGGISECACADKLVAHLGKVRRLLRKEITWNRWNYYDQSIVYNRRGLSIDIGIDELFPSVQASPHRRRHTGVAVGELITSGCLKASLGGCRKRRIAA